MRKGILVGLGAVAVWVLAVAGATDASACSRRIAPCGGYGYAPPVAYQYAPPAPVYGYGPPPAYYAPPVYGRVDYYGPVTAPYGYRPRRYCNRGYGYGNGYYENGYYGNGNGYYGNGNGYYGNGYGYAPPVAYEGYRPAGVWVPVR
jgi:hypothetical protein